MNRTKRTLAVLCVSGLVIWVENEAGASAPVCLNRPRLSWIGPIDERAAPDSAKRIFGFNLAHDHGKTLSHVYCRPAAGGVMTALPVIAVEPYAVTFTAPAPIGSYQVYLHAGHGGNYGWSAPLDLTVAVPWTRGTNSVTVKTSGSDDLQAIQNAIHTMAGQANGGTVRLVAGTYHLRPTNTGGSLQLKGGVCLCGAGKEATVLHLEWSGRGEEPALSLAENSQVEALTIRIGSMDGNGRILRASGRSRLVNLRVDGDAGLTDGSPCLLFEKGEITGCDLYRWIFTAGADGLWIHHNNLYGTLHGMDGAIGTIFPNTRM